MSFGLPCDFLGVPNEFWRSATWKLSEINFTVLGYFSPRSMVLCTQLTTGIYNVQAGWVKHSHFTVKTSDWHRVSVTNRFKTLTWVLEKHKSLSVVYVIFFNFTLCWFSSLRCQRLSLGCFYHSVGSQASNTCGKALAYFILNLF